MNPGRYTIKSFFTYQNLDQVLIPEIQRDYVWGVSNIQKLLNSLLEDFNSTAIVDAEITDEFIRQLPKQAREYIVRGLEQQKTYSNIGFIYAYFDQEQIDKYLLIDGQQRLTSVYLILLYLYIKENKADRFRKIYFANNNPKVDYKVRESAHLFMIEFVDYLLNGGDINNIKEQFWYFTIYDADVTITSLIENYIQLSNQLSGEELTVDYLENQVEFWYFDTSQSEQGEDLYLFMNSRGETVQSNENIKAELLEHKSDAEKSRWGLTWEDWQNKFWLNKGGSPNADRGFDEFLRWIKIINMVKKRNIFKNVDLSEHIKEIRETEKLNTENLSLEMINSHYDAMIRLLDADIPRFFNKSYLETKPQQIDYVRILPLLMYAEKYPKASQINLLRVARFFFNISRFDNIVKNAFRFIGQVIILMDDLLESGLTDVTELMRFREGENYDQILTDEEMKKLLMYSSTSSDFERKELESVFWDAEDFNLCNGRISIIWSCINFDPFLKGKDSFNKDRFNAYFNTFKNLFGQPTDPLRRAFLTKGDYSFEDGYSNVINAPRYSFGLGAESWRRILHDGNGGEFLKPLLSDFRKRKRANKELTNEEILRLIVSDYLLKVKEQDWTYHFIANYKVLNYCKNKMACFATLTLEGVILLEGKLAVVNGYMVLKDFIKTNKPN